VRHDLCCKKLGTLKNPDFPVNYSSGLILIMLGLPAAALVTIILVIMSIKRSHDQKNHQL